MIRSLNFKLAIIRLGSSELSDAFDLESDTLPVPLKVIAKPSVISMMSKPSIASKIQKLIRSLNFTLAMIRLGSSKFSDAFYLGSDHLLGLLMAFEKPFVLSLM